MIIIEIQIQKVILSGGVMKQVHIPHTHGSVSLFHLRGLGRRIDERVSNEIMIILKFFALYLSLLTLMRGWRLEIRNNYSLLSYYHKLDNLRYWLPTYVPTFLPNC